ncbi:Phosphatidyl-N-methylethanolamine N-methyltransferase [Coemansia sp. S3946]|nr:Phosphatidyl-N-methylethanolamine N-methyltransferase [Coemansia sp. S3946]
MNLDSAYAAHQLFVAAHGQQHTLEVYLDYTCPFSAKLWRTLTSEVIPHIAEASLGVSIVFRHQVQPWHPTSTLLHEASLAVEKLNPLGFVPFSQALFEHQREYFDEANVEKTRTETYRQLADLAASINAIDDRQTMLQLLDIQPSAEARNAGNAVTNDLKYHIRLARAKAVHVSPTVAFDGVADDSGCYAIAIAIFSMGIIRDALYNQALNDQPTLSLLDNALVRLVAGLLFISGMIFVATSTYALGITGTFLGDYFGILMSERVTGFPFNVLENPMYVGSTMSFLGTALWHAKPAGLLITAYVWLVYWVALQLEGPFTAMIYANASKAKTEKQQSATVINKKKKKL